MEQQEFQSQVLEFMRNTEQRFTHIDQRLELMHEDIRDLKQDMRFTRQDITEIQKDITDLRKGDAGLYSKLEEVYQSRNFVKIKFGWEWSAVSFAIAFLASGISSGLTKFVWK